MGRVLQGKEGEERARRKPRAGRERDRMGMGRPRMKKRAIFPLSTFTTVFSYLVSFVHTQGRNVETKGHSKQRNHVI